MSRKPIIAGNWKMNLLQADAKALYEGIKSFVDKFDAPQLPTVIIAPVFTSLNQVAEIPCNCGCGELNYMLLLKTVTGKNLVLLLVNFLLKC